MRNRFLMVYGLFPGTGTLDFFIVISYFSLSPSVIFLGSGLLKNMMVMPTGTFGLRCSMVLVRAAVAYDYSTQLLHYCM